MARWHNQEAGTDGFSGISDNSINALLLNAAPCLLFGIEFFTPNSVIGWLKIYNLARVPNPAGGDVPKRRYMLPGVSGGTGLIKSFARGLYFSNGIAIAITGLLPDADATAVAAGGFAVNLDYF